MVLVIGNCLLLMKKYFYLDHPVWINDHEILFLTRGKDRDFHGDFNKPLVLALTLMKLEEFS